MQDERSVAIALEGVTKRFGKHEAVRDLTVSIRERSRQNASPGSPTTNP